MTKVIKTHLKHKDIGECRESYKKKQRGICAICKCDLSAERVHLDHSHETGDVRGALCSFCNEMEGKVTNSRYRTKRTHLVWIDQIAWLSNLLRYLRKHKKNPSGIIHPTFDMVTQTQKRKKYKKRKSK